MRGITTLVLVLALSALGPQAAAETTEENADDAEAGSAVPLACAPHPSVRHEEATRRAPAGSLLCEGFVLSETPPEEFHAALDVSLAVPPGPGPFPLLVQVHGYGGSKGGTGEDGWVLSEAIAFLRYSTRGFGASYGDNQLADEDFEIRDLQNLVRAVVEGSAFAAPPPFALDRKRIAVTGASYGGGHSLLLAQTERRTWPCAPDTCELVTAVPLVPWTDLVYSLVPNGRPSMRVDEADYVIGVEKLSYVSALFAGGYRHDPRYHGSSYPPFFFRYVSAINAGDPYQDPLTRRVLNPVVEEAARTLTVDRSPAYQDYCSEGPLPMLLVQGWTDDLFTAHESVRIRDELRAQCGGEYPLKMYLGNSGHPRARDDDPREQAYILSLVREWLRHWLLGQGPRPRYDVSAGVTPPPGEPFDPSSVMTVPTLEALGPGRARLELEGPAKITFTPSTPTANDLRADPVAGFAGGEGLMQLGALNDELVETVGAPQPGAASWRLTSDELAGRTLCGIGEARLRGRVAGSDVQYAVRIWDVSPEGDRYLVDRGVYRFLGAPGPLDVTVPLHGNVWRFRAGHTVEVEVTNTDTPYLRTSNQPSATVLESVDGVLPTCEAGRVEVLAAAIGRPPARADDPGEELPRSGGGAVPAGLLLIAAAAAMHGRRLRA